MSRKIAVLSIIILITVSGCLGGILSGKSNNFGPETFNESSAQKHIQSVQATSNFTSETTVQLNLPRETLSNITINTTQKIDTVNEKYYFRQTSPYTDSLIERYTTGNITYMKQPRVNSGVNYFKGSEPYNNNPRVTPAYANTEISPSPSSNLLFSNVTYTREGYKSYNGERVAIYSTSGQELIQYFRQSGGAPNQGNITAANSTMYMSEEGILLYQEYTFEIENENGVGTISVVRRIHSINSTSVSEPGWIQEAKDNTD